MEGVVVKETGEWLVEPGTDVWAGRGPGMTSDRVTEAPCWYQSVCLCGLPCAVKHHGVGGEAGRGETHSHSKY